MKKISAMLMLIIVSCATSPVVVDTAYIEKDFGLVIGTLRAARGNYYELGKRRLGASGFYYVIDREGIVVFHPQAVLIGADMKNLWFMRRIIDEGSGCFHYRLGERNHLIYFRPIDNKEILCLSIPSREVSDFARSCEFVEKPQ